MKTKIISNFIKKVPNTVLGDASRLIPGPWTSGRLKASKGRHPGTWDQWRVSSAIALELVN